MNIETLDKKTMESVQKLAAISCEISNGKATLAELQSNLGDFLKKREKLANEQLNRILEESVSLVVKIGENLKQVEDFYSEIKSFSVFLNDLHGSFKKEIELYTKTQLEFDSKMRDAIASIESMKESNNQQKRDIEREKSVIIKQKKELSDIKTEIKSRQESIKASLNLIQKYEQK